MPSIHPDYEYDIFISYRQNDNKRDSWVTNFVDALRDELEATLKNPISIYFDENPHDGLLETHQVDASLAKKLKCLVFIPIISQTYCDDTSFAWEHEFMPFIKMAKEDKLGMNITLSNGNVVSRVLPVKIHRLDIEDQNTLEAVLDGPLRSIGFIYQEAGVNRPLKPDDDRNLNLEKTDYHNQVNKVANALKDIGLSLLKQSDGKINVPPPERERPAVEAKSSKKGIYIGLAIIIIALLAYWGYKQFYNSPVSEIEDITIAVLAFDDMNVDEDNDWFSKGLSIDIHTYLSKVENLTIISESAVKEAFDSEKSLPEIAELLNVTHFVGGSVRQFNNDIKISVHLTKVSNDKNLWEEIYNGNLDNPFKIQQDISQKIVTQLEVELTPEEEKNLNKYPTENIEAYALFVKGNLINDSREKEDLELNIELNKQAIAIDPNFAEAYAEIAQSTFLLGVYFRTDYPIGKQETIPYLEKALQLDPNNAKANSIKGILTSLGGDWNKAQEYFEKAIASNPNSATIRSQYALHSFGRNNERDDNKNFVQTAIAQQLNPLSAFVGHLFFVNLIIKEKIEEAEEYYNKYSFLFTYAGEKLEKQSILIAYKNKDWTAAIRFFEAEIEKNPNNAILNRKLGEAYDGILIDNINYLKYTKKAYELDSTNLDNGVEYHNALLRNNDFIEAKKLIQGENFKTLFDPKEKLNILFYYYYYQENYKKAQEIFKKGSLLNDNYYKAIIFAQLGDRESLDSLIDKNLSGTYSKAFSYAILEEKDSMYYYLERIEALDRSRYPTRSYRWFGLRTVNSWREFDPYRKEERFKAILRKNYLPITHWNE